MTKQITIDLYQTAVAVRIEMRDAYDIRETLKGRGYRFAAVGTQGLPAWTLTIARAEMDVAKAEAAWIKTLGAVVIPRKEV